MENWQHDNRLTPYFREIQEVRNNWGYFLTFGILLMILGGIAISYGFYTTLFSVFVLGILLIVSGVAQIIQSFWARRWTGLFLSMLVGILYIVTGFLCISRPAESALSITLIISLFLLVGGLYRMLSSAFLQFEKWGWVFFNGIVTFILGLIIYTGWPVSGLWVIGLFVGIDMVLTGWAWVLLALAARPQKIT